MSGFQTIRERMNDIRDEVLLRWLKDQTDLPVILADHSDPRPDEPHVSFKLLTNFIKLGSLDELVPEMSTDPTPVPTGKFTLRAHREFTIAIEAVGTPVGPSDDLDDFLRATDILNGVHMSLDLPTVRAIFDKYDVAIVDEGGVTDLSQILETETEPRALLEIVLRARFDITDNPGYFYSVEFAGALDTTGDGVFDKNTGTINVP